MKKYKLKQWYPSLDEEWDTTHRYEYQSSTGYMCNKSIQHCVIIYKKELHSDFWEEIEDEKPLFITEDGVEITDGMQSVIAIDSDINVEYTRYQWANKKDLIFGSKEGADEYIWRNKPLFSYEDFMKWGNVPYERVIMQLAKERANEK